MAEYKLYAFGESGNSYKAALMLALTGTDWELVPVDYFNGETRGAAFRDTVNAMGAGVGAQGTDPVPIGCHP
jgi:glutathione S-transferase